jgi:CDGSH-type Zn-finger protein/uncharacterized Fe-S cluster protein YjdI
VWNVTASLGGAPRFGRTNFPLDPGYLPAGVVVKLAPFNEEVLQHFIHLERPHGSAEPDGAGFAPERHFQRSVTVPRLTPTGADYETVGDFYQMLGRSLRALVGRLGEEAVFCGDAGLQLSADDSGLPGIKKVRCLKSALEAFDAIIAQGEGAQEDLKDSHFQKFRAIRDEFQALKRANPSFTAAHPAAHNPVFRRPPRPEGRVWIENPEAAELVDLGNACYGLMLRFLAYGYNVSGPSPHKSAAIDLGIGLMRALAALAEAAARLPAGPSNPHCNAGLSFVALRDSAALPAGASAWRFFEERLGELLAGAVTLAARPLPGAAQAERVLRGLAARAADMARLPAPSSAPPVAAIAPARPEIAAPSGDGSGIETVESEGLSLIFEGKRCIHSRLCVTGAPEVFLANVEGPWIHPEAMAAEELAAIARSCPSGAIRYRRKDGHPDEAVPPVNLLAIRENGPYAVRADIRLDGKPDFYRATLCRCGASKNKPYCDGSHHAAEFTASGEPASGETAMLAVRDGALSIDPQLDGPLQVRGNLEITSGTGRVVARLQSARLCRCGGSQNKPFCDGSHARNGFRS